MHFSRRNFLRLSGAGLIVSQAPSVLAGDFSHSKPVPGTGVPFELGIASYTFREFSLDETIAMTKSQQIKKLCLKSMHMPLDSTPEAIKSMAAKVRQAGIDLYGAGVVYMKSVEEVDQAFTYAANAGLKVIVGVPEHALLNHCNKRVKETGIQVAIHNHGPGDDMYPSPQSVYDRVKHLDPRMGLCIDIGHTARIGLDPSRETARFMDRVLDIHIKDVDKGDETGKTLQIGHGIIDIPGFLNMLVKKNYSKVVSFEYEKDGNDPLAGLAESVGYVRGVLQMLA